MQARGSLRVGAALRAPRALFAVARRRFSSIVPVIDLSKPRAQVAREIETACREIGFLSIVNHGVSPAVLANMDRESTRYFDLPLADKRAVPMTPDYPYGYSGFGEENLSRGLGDGTTRPDLKESFSIGPHNPLAGMPPVQWPDNEIEFRRAWEAYWGSMEVPPPLPPPPHHQHTNIPTHQHLHISVCYHSTDTTTSTTTATTTNITNTTTAPPPPSPPPPPGVVPARPEPLRHGAGARRLLFRRQGAPTP
jgi:hypothetical protein